MKTFSRFLAFLLLALTGLLLLLFLLLSPILKWAIQKYDVEYTNREILIDQLWINLFTGYVELGGVEVKEEKSNERFLAFSKFSLNIELTDLLKDRLTIHDPLMENLYIQVLRHDSVLNMNDMIRKFTSPANEPADTGTTPFEYNIFNTRLENATIYIYNQNPETKLTLDSLRLHLPLISSSNPNMHADTRFLINSGGAVENSLDLNMNTLDYAMTSTIDKLNLQFLYPSLKAMMNVKSFNGLLSVRMETKGNFNAADHIACKGKLRVEQFSIIDPLDNPLMGVDTLSIDIDSLNTGQGIYKFNNLTLWKPVLLFELYDNGTNFDRLMTSYSAETADTVSTPDYANIFSMMAGYISEIASEYAVSDYSSEKIRMYNSHITYKDYTLHETFLFELTEMNLNADQLSSAHELINLSMESILNGSGLLKATLSMETANLKNINLEYSIRGLRVSDFNPYTVYYVAFPFLNGDIEYICKTTIKDGKLKSSNKINVNKVNLGGKIENRTAFDLPMKLAVALLKDQHGDIHLDVPVEGDLNDPKYKIGKIIWQVLKNIIIKAATAPYKLLAGMFGGNEDELKELVFEPVQYEGLTSKQEKQLKMIAKILKEKPGLKAEFTQMNSIPLATEQVALRDMKIDFLRDVKKIEKGGPEQWEDTDSLLQFDKRDSMFVEYINNRSAIKDTLMPISEKCIRIIGKAELESRVLKRIDRRNQWLVDYLSRTLKVDPSRFSVKTRADQEKANTLSVSKFNIEYKAADETIGSPAAPSNLSPVPLNE